MTALFVDDSLLFVALESGLINIYEIDQAQPKYKNKLELNDKVIVLYKKIGKSRYLLFDERGVGMEVSLGRDCAIQNFSLKVLG